MTARIAAVSFMALVLLFLILPICIIVPLSFSSDSFLSFPPPGWSFRWYHALAVGVDYRAALVNSALIGLPVALLATLFGTLAAIALARGDLPGRRLLSSIMIAPVIIPEMVLAIGLYPIMVQLGIIGSYPAVILGQTTVCTPLVFITVTAALRGLCAKFRAGRNDPRRRTLGHVPAGDVPDDTPVGADRRNPRFHLFVRRTHPRDVPRQPGNAHDAAPAVGTIKL